MCLVIVICENKFCFYYDISKSVSIEIINSNKVVYNLSKSISKKKICFCVFVCGKWRFVIVSIVFSLLFCFILLKRYGIEYKVIICFVYVYCLCLSYGYIWYCYDYVCICVYVVVKIKV